MSIPRCLRTSLLLLPLEMPATHSRRVVPAWSGMRLWHLILTASGLVTAGFCTACEEPIATVVYEARLATTGGWSEGEILVISEGFRGDSVLPVVQFDTLELAVRRIDDSTFAATLPMTSGSHTLTVRSPRIQPLSATITVYGFTETQEYSPGFLWDILVWPRLGHASVLAVSALGLTLIELDTRIVTVFDSIFNRPDDLFLGKLRGPGVTYEDGVFLVWPINSSTLESWTLGISRSRPPNPKRVAAHPGIDTFRQVMQLGPDVWLRSGHHWIDVISRPDSNQLYRYTSIRAEETEGVLMSPRGDRATVRVDYVEDGIPVFKVPTGEVAYYVTSQQTAADADFSSDGEVLAIVGGIDHVQSSKARVLLLQAATGEILGDTTLDKSVFSVALDPVRPLLYVGASEPDTARFRSHPVVFVLERSTFRVVAKLGVPKSVPRCWSGCYRGVIALSAEPALYVVGGASSPNPVYRFTLPPGNGSAVP